jgi:hypothetical protein
MKDRDEAPPTRLETSRVGSSACDARHGNAKRFPSSYERAVVEGTRTPSCGHRFSSRRAHPDCTLAFPRLRGGHGATGGCPTCLMLEFPRPRCQTRCMRARALSQYPRARSLLLSGAPPHSDASVCSVTVACSTYTEQHLFAVRSERSEPPPGTRSATTERISNPYILWRPAKCSYSILYVAPLRSPGRALRPKHPTTLNSVQVGPTTSQEVSPNLFRGSPQLGPGTPQNHGTRSRA